MSLGIRLSGIRLSGIRLSGIRLSGIRLSGIRLSGIRYPSIRLSAIRYPVPAFSTMPIFGFEHLECYAVCIGRYYYKLYSHNAQIILTACQHVSVLEFLCSQNGIFDSGISFPCVIQKNTKFANFTGLYFLHFTAFGNQALQFY